MEKLKNKYSFALKRESKNGRLSKPITFNGIKKFVAGVMIAVTALLPLSACENKEEITSAVDESGVNYDLINGLQDLMDRIENDDHFASSEILIVSVRDLVVDEKYLVDALSDDFIMLIKLKTERYSEAGFDEYINLLSTARALVSDKLFLYEDKNAFLSAEMIFNRDNIYSLDVFLKSYCREDLVKEDGYTRSDLVKIIQQINGIEVEESKTMALK